MMRASPRLESLSLIFDFYESLEDSDEALSMEDQFSQLSNVIFPHLRVLRAVSRFLSPISPALQQFLRNHPKLNTLAFGSVRKNMPRVIGVDEIVAIASAVRHFEGPAFLVEPLLQSEISSQLESLSICGDAFLDKELGPIMQGLSRTPLLKLSALRTLRVEP
ncbi:hypothetical protein FRC12_004980 [Ceratobasidium sp. 428]|nr:hypothetical protein FRC12_004980 [Ceratobasidium sp. 428]